MAVDPSIALGGRPVEVQNPLNAFAQASQIQAFQRQNELANRAIAQEDALNKAYASSLGEGGEIDPNKLRQNVIRANLGSKLPSVEKTLLEGRKLKTEVGKAELELGIAQAEKSIRDIAAYNTREDALRHIQQDLTNKKISPQQAQQFAAMLPPDDAGMPQFQLQMLRRALSAKDQLEQHFVSQDTGGGTRVVAMPKYGGGPAKVVQGSAATKTMTPGESANLVKPVWNEAGQGWVTPPTAANPKGGFTPVPEVQATKDQRSAIKALSTAGYNPLTGEDEISKLIAKSTGGMAQQLGSAIAGSANITTSGREAIGRLKTRANQISLDMLNGKLGAGISNDDRNFIVSTLGNVADPSVPAGERLAAWEEAKARMVSTGMIPAPKPAAPAPLPPTPKGVDNSIWNAMTPEERALWK